MAKIVIVGAGVGGIPMAMEMKHHARKEDEVIVISNYPTFHFVPSNPWVAFGWRKPEKIKVALAPLMKKKHITFIHQSLTKLIPQNNTLELADGTNLQYDYLVLATGPQLAFDEIQGLGPSGFTQSVCHVDHAEETYHNWLNFCKNPGPMIVGAVQGASCFGPAYEYIFQADKDLRKKKLRDQVPMTVVTSEPYVGHLGLGGVGDSKGLMESQLRDKSIRWICNAKIEKIEDGKMFVQECDDEGKEKQKHELPFKLSMLIPPFRGIDPLKGIDGLVNPRGFVLINPYQQNPTFKNIYAVGVCVAIAPKEPTPVPTGVPKTGLMIESMAVAAAKNIRYQLDGAEPQAVPAWNALCIADMGDNGLGFVASPQIPPRNITISKRGYSMHLAKVIFEKYYIHKIKGGKTAPIYERIGLSLMGLHTLKK